MSSSMITLPPRTTPVVISVCACAAIGALIAPAIAAMASILFRMVNSFAMMHAGLCRHAIPPQFIARGIVPQIMRIFPLQFSAFYAGAGTR
jgi:hypothetical protein